jgi:hypothetical protein
MSGWADAGFSVMHFPLQQLRSRHDDVSIIGIPGISGGNMKKAGFLVGT